MCKMCKMCEMQSQRELLLINAAMTQHQHQHQQMLLETNNWTLIVHFNLYVTVGWKVHQCSALSGFEDVIASLDLGYEGYESH